MNELRAMYVIEEGEEVTIDNWLFFVSQNFIISGDDQLPSHGRGGRGGQGS